jgi:hypothetical protein
MDNYILDETGTPVVEPDLITWALWWEKADRTVERTDINETVYVSTVFLGTDHRFGREGKPLLWETLVFGYQRELLYRYTSRERALSGHRHVVRYMRAVIAKEQAEYEAHIVKPVSVASALQKKNRVVILDDVEPLDIPERVLTEEGEALKSSFEQNNEAVWGRSCTCFQGHAPCSWCTDPGNPLNLREDETMWREKTQEEVRLDRMKRKIQLEE